MIKCTCGHEIGENSKFCPFCGTKLLLCPQCQAIVESGAKFCSNCGYNVGEQSNGLNVSAKNDGNVIAGDVSGSYNTNISHTTNHIHNTTNNVTNHQNVTNNIFQAIETDENCYVCNAVIPHNMKSFFQCASCGRYTCQKHFHAETKRCNNCHQEEKKHEFESLRSNLKAGRYDAVLQYVEREKNVSSLNADAYYYAAIALLHGKSAYSQNKQTIEEAVSYVEQAINISHKGIYRYFLSYIKQDYYATKFLRVTPDAKTELLMAKSQGVSPSEINDLFELLKVTKPKGL